MPTCIRKATIHDSENIAHLIRVSFEDVANRFNLSQQNCPTHPSNCTKEWILAALDKGIIFYVLELDTKLVGCFALEKATKDVYYLERLSVLPECRNRGFGRQMVNYAIKKVANFKAHRIEIGIISKQVELHKWYKNIGFEVKSKRYFKHLPFKVTFMFFDIK